MIHAYRKPTQTWAYRENKLFTKTLPERFLTTYIILSSF